MAFPNNPHPNVDLKEKIEVLIRERLSHTFVGGKPDPRVWGRIEKRARRQARIRAKGRAQRPRQV